MITSAQNPLLKAVRKALTRSTLTADGRLAAETWKLFEEAVARPAEITHILCEPRLRADVDAALAGDTPEIREVDPKLLAATASTETSPGIITLVRPGTPKWADLTGSPTRLIVADGIQDPGNLGTIIRTADALGATGLVTLKGTVSPWNAKAVRGSAGSVLRLPLLAGLEPSVLTQWLGDNQVEPYLSDAARGQPAHSISWDQHCAIILGSEAAGPASAVWSNATHVRIPLEGVESLNVAVAAALLLYEAARPR